MKYSVIVLIALFSIILLTGCVTTNNQTAKSTPTPTKIKTQSSVQTQTPTASPTPSRGCICTAQYSPVCGKDGKTYNACTAECDKIEIEYEGECKQTTPTPSPTNDNCDLLQKQISDELNQANYCQIDSDCVKPYSYNVISCPFGHSGNFTTIGIINLNYNQSSLTENVAEYKKTCSQNIMTCESIGMVLPIKCINSKCTESMENAQITPTPLPEIKQNQTEFTDQEVINAINDRNYKYPNDFYTGEITGFDSKNSEVYSINESPSSGIVIFKNSSLGEFSQRPITEENIKELGEYLWHTKYYNLGGEKVLSSFTQDSGNSIKHTIYETSVIFGDWNKCDEIMLFKIENTADKNSGIITQIIERIRTIEGNCQ